MAEIISSKHFLLRNDFIKRIYCKIFYKRQLVKYYHHFYAKQSNEKSNGKKILMFVGIGHMFLTPIEILMYHYYKSAGYEVDYFIYDERCKLNEIITFERMQKQGKEKFWNKSVALAKQCLHAAQVNFKIIEPNIEVEELLDSIPNMMADYFQFQYDGVHFGKIVENTMYRFYKSTNKDLMQPNIARDFLHTALNNYLCVKNLYHKNDYILSCFSHGIYCTWAPIVAFCNANQKKFFCYDRGKRNQTMNFNFNLPAPIWDISSAWKRYQSIKLNQQESESTKKYFHERELQKNDVYAYNVKEKENDLIAMKKKLQIPMDKIVLTIFTNLIWDAANINREISFPSPFDCIVKTIDFVSARSDLHLLIRPHPAEKILGTKQTYSTLLKEHFGYLPNCVSIAETEMEYNSFSVIDITDISIVHTSTVGLEIAMLGKPIILISETNYRGKGFTFDAESEDHYFKLLAQLCSNPLSLPNQIELAEKYFFMMMFLYQHQIPILELSKQFNGYRYRDVHDFNKQHDGSVQRVLLHALDNDSEDFIFWNN